MILEEVRQINWEDVLPETEDVNLTFESFHNKLSDIINTHAPLHKLSKKEIRILVKPSITNGIRVSIAKKNKLYELYIKSKNGYYFSKFKTYRNKLKHFILVSKKSYYNKYFANNKYNIKNTWKGIKKLITLNHQPYLVLNLLEVENLKLTNSKSIVNAFKNYFSSIGSNIANTIPIIDISFEKFLNKSLFNSVFLSPVSTLEVEEEISNLNPSKSVGPFSIPTKLLKNLRFLLSGPLAYLFNCSFLTGVVPDQPKLARVIPIYKKGSKSVVSNYRPISLLSVSNKILEKLMYKRLVIFLEKNQVIFQGQFGFRSYLIPSLLAAFLLASRRCVQSRTHLLTYV